MPGIGCGASSSRSPGGRQIPEHPTGKGVQAEVVGQRRERVEEYRDAFLTTRGAATAGRSRIGVLGSSNRAGALAGPISATPGRSRFEAEVELVLARSSSSPAPAPSGGRAQPPSGQSRHGPRSAARPRRRAAPPSLPRPSAPPNPCHSPNSRAPISASETAPAGTSLQVRAGSAPKTRPSDQAQVSVLPPLPDARFWTQEATGLGP